MPKSTVVGPVSKPSPEQLLEMLKTFSDRQAPEIRRQLEAGALVVDDVQGLIEHRGRYITVVSDGLTGEQSISRLEAVKYNLGDEAKFLMRSKDYIVTNGVVYRVGIIKDSEFDDASRTTENICKEAMRRCWIEPPAELARLLREKLSDEDLEKMGFVWLIVVHKTIAASDGYPNLLGLDRRGAGRKLNTAYSIPGRRWSREYGFAFLVPQVS